MPLVVRAQPSTDKAWRSGPTAGYLFGRGPITKSTRRSRQGPAVHDRRHASDRNVAVEDVIDDEILAADLDDDYLRDVLHESRRYLPPPGARARRREDETPPEPENPLVRRAKLAALVLASALLLASIIVAATVADNDERPAASLPATEAALAQQPQTAAAPDPLTRKIDRLPVQPS